ncbi:MAG: GNAT family N-acetyltransferase, partial [Candidatus Cloacimonetes bacterium]|nr:GNAT family N-acetyltransferase [Candidatus Cloacimonadota bacterium]
KEYRQQGIGKKMIQEIIRLIKDKGFSIMRLDVWAFNREARQFFRSVGFKPLVERMEMKLR